MATSSAGTTRRGDRSPLIVGLAVAVAVPGLVLRVGGLHLSPPVDALLFGLAIIGAAFLLSWAAEAAQVDISAGLAIALLALVAVLPEYAVDFVFTIQGGNAYAQYGPTCLPPGSTEQSPCGLALANMTGANRILVGVGWALVVLLAAFPTIYFAVRRSPLLTLAAARLLGYEGSHHHLLAATVEFIHTATLLHDDIVDASELRRGKVAAHLIWGAPTSVLVGDYLFARSFQLMTDTGNLPPYLPELPCWTLIVTGRRSRGWGFWCRNKPVEEQFVPWQDFGDAGCGETS